MKKWYASKTVWFSVLFGVVQLAALFGFADFQPSADVVELVGLIGAGVMLVLRFVTNKGVQI